MNTAALAASNATHSRRSGSTSANQGSIHRSYWGEYALFVSRKSTSKGNASVQVRELLELGMVRKVWVRRSRRDYYEAVTDLWSIAAEVIGRRLEQEARSLLAAVSETERELPDATEDLVKARVRSMRLFLELVAAGIEGFRRGEVMSPEGLRKLAS